MYIAIRSYDGVKFPEEAAAKVRKEFLPVISEIPGFLEYYAVKTGDSTVASISIFKDKPGADQSVQAARTWVQKHMTRFLPNPPKVISGDSIAQGDQRRLYRPCGGDSSKVCGSEISCVME